MLYSSTEVDGCIVLLDRLSKSPVGVISQATHTLLWRNLEDRYGDEKLWQAVHAHIQVPLLIEGLLLDGILGYLFNAEGYCDRPSMSKLFDFETEVLPTHPRDVKHSPVVLKELGKILDFYSRNGVIPNQVLKVSPKGG